MAKGQWPWSRSNGIRRAETVEEVINRLSMPLTECGCYVWLGELNNWGYPIVYYKTGPNKPTIKRAQRVIYELTKGPIPDGLVVDHTCNNTWCVNPDHYEAVTASENNRRRRPYVRKFCKNGHPLDETRKNGRCSICSKIWKQRENEQRRLSGYWTSDEYKRYCDDNREQIREKDRRRYQRNKQENGGI